MHITDRVQRFLATSPALVKLAVKVRNQTQMLIGYHLGESFDHDLNGEAAIVKLVAPHCESFVDVGANVGSWTELFLRHSNSQCRGLLFEPGEGAYHRLAKKIEEYESLEVIQMAVGREAGEVDFFEEPGAGTTSSVLEDATSASAEKVSVAVTTLEEEINARGWSTIDYVKIDTEGNDYHVLCGARKLLSQQRIGLLQFEYNGSWAAANATLSGAFQLLKENQYSCYLVRSDGLFKLDYSFYGEYFLYSNYLAVSDRWMSVVSGQIKGKI